jgi:hypothetical protein
MSHPVGYYTNYTPGDTGVLDQLQARYGVRLEGIDRTNKLLFRATLATYLVIYPIWNPEGSSISCADCCIAGAGGDDFNIWDNQPELVQHMEACCEQLSESDIEGLIEALTSQLRSGV